ncbi:MAG: magnesium transporter CorA [Eubacterium sp.]|nr:magnesium transporter CorA [Eubacterium sp.]
MYYLIKSTLEQCGAEEVHTGEFQYVVVLSPEEWKREQGSFDIGIEMDINTDEIHNTKAEVNFDSLTGTFCIPSRRNITEIEYKYAFAIDEKGIVFIDPSGVVDRMIKRIARRKKWKVPCLERFIYDFLELIISRDLSILEGFEKELDSIEADILEDVNSADLERANEIRGEIRDLRIHYEQMIDLGQELEENENNFFKPENTRYFRLFTDRMTRLHDASNSIRDYTVQIRDLYHTQMEIKQNRVMTLLTVVTTIFMPLTLIAGWYGMNFRYMPELESRWGYPIVILVSLAIIIISLLFFRKKKWL